MALVGTKNIKTDSTDKSKVITRMKSHLTERQLGIVDLQFKEIISFFGLMGLPIEKSHDKELLDAIRIKLMKEL